MLHADFMTVCFYRTGIISDRSFTFHIAGTFFAHVTYIYELDLICGAIFGHYRETLR